jgi:hypothetical protein
VNEAVAIEIKLPDIEFKLAKLLVIVENCANDPEMLPVMPKLALTYPTKLPVIFPFKDPVIDTKSASVPTILPVTLPVKLPTTAVTEIFGTANVFVFGLYANPMSDLIGFTPVLSANNTNRFALVLSPPEMNAFTAVVAYDAVPSNDPDIDPVNEPVNNPLIFNVLFGVDNELLNDCNPVILVLNDAESNG